MEEKDKLGSKKIKYILLDYWWELACSHFFTSINSNVDKNKLRNIHDHLLMETWTANINQLSSLYWRWLTSLPEFWYPGR